MSDLPCCNNGGGGAPPQPEVQRDSQLNDLQTSMGLSPSCHEPQDQLTLKIPSSAMKPSTSPPRATFTLGAPASRRPSSSSSSSSSLSSSSSSRAAHSPTRRRSSLSPSRVTKSNRNDSIITCTTSIVASSSSNADVTSPTCKRSDSACFSDITSSSGASSTVEFSRATSCAHPECVMAAPSERMIELSNIINWPTLSQSRRMSSPASSDGGANSVPLSPSTPSRRHRGLMILDNACGSSALVTSHLIDVLSNARATGENLASDDDLEEEEDDNLMMDTQILASDLSQKVVSQATRRIAELDWADHVFTFKMNQEHMLGLGDGDLTHVFTNFGIYLSKDVDSTLKEMKRVLMPGGICAFTVWKHLPWLEVLAKAIKTEYPARPMNFPSHDDALMSLTGWNPWHDPEWIKKKVTEAGFLDVEHCGNGHKMAGEEVKEDNAEKKEVEDWSQYEYQSGEARSTSRRNSEEVKQTPRSPIGNKAGASSTSSSAPSSPSFPTSETKGSIIIEEITSTHRYTKHEFMSNFGTSVLDHLLAAAWGKERLSKDETRRDLREAVSRYLIKICPDQMDEIELELTALVVVVKKGEQVDTPSEM